MPEPPFVVRTPPPPNRRVVNIEQTEIPSPNPVRAAQGVKCWRLHLECGHDFLFARKIRPSFVMVGCSDCQPKDVVH